MALFRRKQASEAPQAPATATIPPPGSPNEVQGVLVMSRRPLADDAQLLQQIVDQQKAEGKTISPDFVGMARPGDWTDQAYVYASIRTVFSKFGEADVIDRTRVFSFQGTDGNEGKYYILFGAERPAAPVPAAADTTRLYEVFGDELSEKLIGLLGAARAAEFAETALDDALRKWIRRNDPTLLTEEEKEEMARASAASGTNTLMARAAFHIKYLAELVSGKVAKSAMENYGLPDDQDLYLDIGARIYLALDSLLPKK